MAEAGSGGSDTFRLLERLYADRPMVAVFSETSTVESWLTVEASLARSQAKVGVLSDAVAAEIARSAVLDNVDLGRLWTEARNVGYPILPLVRMIAATLPDGPDGRVHYGATTQDVMDAGLALQLTRATQRLRELLDRFGDALAEHVRVHQTTVMAARTHAQQAVPTTFGAVLATYLSELNRHRVRIAQATPRVCRISLFGAGGTSAAYGKEAAEIRELMARELGLSAAAVPWHVSRDGLAEFGSICAMIVGTSARFAQTLVDLSRTEISEVSEPRGYHRGASSTMAQKANPILAEAIIGMAGASAGLAASLYRAMEAGHERAAGEWQIEWQCLPQLAVLAASALNCAAEIAEGLLVEPENMRRNLGADGGAVMAEAYMMRLAGELGRERAHDLLYDAVARARDTGADLHTALDEARNGAGLSPVDPIHPEDYLGEVERICTAALAEWNGPTCRT